MFWSAKRAWPAPFELGIRSPEPRPVSGAQNLNLASKKGLQFRGGGVFCFLLFSAAPTVDGCEIRLAPRKETVVETIVLVGIYRRIIIPGFLRWCEMDFVHPRWFEQERLAILQRQENQCFGTPSPNASRWRVHHCLAASGNRVAATSCRCAHHAR